MSGMILPSPTSNGQGERTVMMNDKPVPVSVAQLMLLVDIRDRLDKLLALASKEDSP